MGPIFPQVAMFVLPLLSLLPLALSDNLWGGVQTGEAVEPSFQQAETVYSPDPAALKVEEQQYQEEPEYQQEAYPVQYQQYPEQPQQYQEPVQEYHQQPQQYLEQYQEEPAPQYQEQYHGDVQQYPGQAQHYPEQPGAPVASRRSGSTLGFTPPPGAYLAPPGSFPGQAAGPPPTYGGDLISVPSQPQQVVAAPGPLHQQQHAVQPRLGLLPSLLAKVRRRLTATTNNIAERRDQAKGWLASLRDFVVSFFSGPEGQARMFSLSSFVIGTILAI